MRLLAELISCTPAVVCRLYSGLWMLISLSAQAEFLEVAQVTGQLQRNAYKERYGGNNPLVLRQVVGHIMHL